ncbi:MAG: 3-keto-5-aminohexanoate cleavage protein [Thermoleophilia bacterium]|nr:3-keto-5-aminohexanoate cleavage protein [Thermoleophilia bacterium]
MEKLIVTCAPTGSLTVPSQTPYLPLTPQEIADEAVRAAEAGCAMVHIHARDPIDGRPTSDPEIYRDIISRIESRSDVVIGITTGGGAGMTAEERVRVVPAVKPQLASLNMGPVCLSLEPVLRRYEARDFKYSWEKPYLAGLSGFIQQNTFDSVEIFLNSMNEAGTKCECECYDLSHINNVAHFVRKGLIKTPVLLQFVTGGLGTVGSAPEDIFHMRNTADQLLGRGNYQWSIVGAGMNYTVTVPLAIMLGGHARVGMEDNIFIERKVLAKSNVEFVEKVVRMARDMGREVATPAEARAILGLPGRDRRP